tara:strand:- start:1192 stop:1383 length:192 start_codon:yes stop_codon:yes gene_type:complete
VGGFTALAPPKPANSSFLTEKKVAVFRRLQFWPLNQFQTKSFHILITEYVLADFAKFMLLSNK